MVHVKRKVQGGLKVDSNESLKRQYLTYDWWF